MRIQLAILTLVFASTITFIGCNAEPKVKTSTDVVVSIQDIRGQSIVYDLYWLEEGERKHISSHISKPSGKTVVTIDNKNDAHEMVVVRKRLKSQSERTVTLEGDTIKIHFLI